MGVVQSGSVSMGPSRVSRSVIGREQGGKKGTRVTTKPINLIRVSLLDQSRLELRLGLVLLGCQGAQFLSEDLAGRATEAKDCQLDRLEERAGGDAPLRDHVDDDDSTPELLVRRELLLDPFCDVGLERRRLGVLGVRDDVRARELGRLLFGVDADDGAVGDERGGQEDAFEPG